MTKQPLIYIDNTQAFEEELELTLLIGEEKDGGSSCHISLWLTPTQIRKFSKDIVEALDYHLKIMECILPSRIIKN